MDRRSLLSGMAATATAAAASGRALAQDMSNFDDPLDGDWGGVLDGGGRRWRLRLVVETGRDGVTATLYSLDDGGQPIPGGNAVIFRDQLRVLFPSIRASLIVRRVANDELAGTWWQGGDAPITFVRDPDFETLLTPRPALSRDYLKDLRRTSGSPALAAAARRRGAPLIEAVDGLRAVDAEAAATLDDSWHLGSITKSATATLVGLAVEAGALSWDTTVGATLGDAVPAMHDAYRRVTPVHLLSHRAGLPAGIPLPALLRYPLEEEDPRESRLAYAGEALAQVPEGPAGVTDVYSNSGYVIVGAMLEARLGVPWEALMRARLFAPLGLASAGFGAPGTPGLLDAPVGHSVAVLGTLGLGDRRTAHRPGSGRTDNPAVLGPAGRVHMTLPDLLRFLAAHRDRSDLLSPASWQRLHMPPFGGSYALGLVVQGDGQLWHNGSNTLWYAEALIDRSRGVVAAAAANDGVLQGSALAVAQALASAADTAAAT